MFNSEFNQESQRASLKYTAAKEPKATLQGFGLEAPDLGQLFLLEPSIFALREDAGNQKNDLTILLLLTSD